MEKSIKTPCIFSKNHKIAIEIFLRLWYHIKIFNFPSHFDKGKDRLFVERGAVFELQDGVFIGSQCRGEGTCVVLGALDEASHLDGPLFQHGVEQDVDGGWLPGPVGGEVDNLRA